jgi:hypothetical protein
MAKWSLIHLSSSSWNPKFARVREEPQSRSGIYHLDGHTHTQTSRVLCTPHAPHLGFCLTSLQQQRPTRANPPCCFPRVPRTPK